MQRPRGDVMKYDPRWECRLLTIKYSIFIWFYWVKSQEWISALDQLGMWNVKIRAHQFLASLWVSEGMCLITVISPNTLVWPLFHLKTQQRPESPARLACFWCCKPNWRANRFPPIKGAHTAPERRRGRFIKGESIAGSESPCLLNSIFLMTFYPQSHLIEHLLIPWQGCLEIRKVIWDMENLALNYNRKQVKRKLFSHFMLSIDGSCKDHVFHRVDSVWSNRHSHTSLVGKSIGTESIGSYLSKSLKHKKHLLSPKMHPLWMWLQRQGK